ncbi:hypothetical protein COCSUDRAFT_34565 [Coccomyxa subellipsoidea C-169]|uniref:Uncharacterized protein n=1 Tax=Coccomyxa subellipsoidea (strain C-169) TaxID=574566 RepID=I0YJ47_COCSC|nr:hypothetical protein COCSUDRAFT_34565 [Coccomyxa subellipsoidea C-169]EIE18416.1 hypothetical protein COCSUDRAFT_34565 [Coccomyxa subellipsoidea C-169]|eukprot:XP_005642960.1 hypothetical protein COCSUDRAFT_34565 [Coccomyxa subellipsoidea C-169]
MMYVPSSMEKLKYHQPIAMTLYMRLNVTLKNAMHAHAGNTDDDCRHQLRQSFATLDNNNALVI